jgi:hypothetical protein
MDTTVEHYEMKLRGARLPLKLLIPELQGRGIAPDDFDSINIESTLYYILNKHPVVASGKFDIIEGGQGVIGFYLNQKMEVSEAIKIVEGLQSSNPKAEKLYSKVQVFLDKRQVCQPIYIFTSVALWKGLPPDEAIGGKPS